MNKKIQIVNVLNAFAVIISIAALCFSIMTLLNLLKLKGIL